MSSYVTVSLPYPPSANRLWRNVRGRTYRSEEYKAWLTAASWAVCLAVKNTFDRRGVQGPYGLTVLVSPPDRRRRDLDNLIKPISDALCKGKAIEDDSLCQQISMSWDAGAKGVQVTVMETSLRIPDQVRRSAA